MLFDVFFSPDESNPRHVRVLYDFTSRNSRELTIRKGDILEVRIHSMEQPLYLFFSALSCCITSVLHLRVAAGHVEAVVESTGQQGRGGLRTQ